MGWCSATEIMDTAIEAAEDALEQLGTVLVDATVDVERELRPFVRKLATTLRDLDWDCVEESDYFDRFGPELLGLTDAQFRAHQAEVFHDEPERFAAWLAEWRQQPGRGATS